MNPKQLLEQANTIHHKELHLSATNHQALPRLSNGALVELKQGSLLYHCLDEREPLNSPQWYLFSARSSAELHPLDSAILSLWQWQGLCLTVSRTPWICLTLSALEQELIHALRQCMIDSKVDPIWLETLSATLLMSLRRRIPSLSFQPAKHTSFLMQQITDYMHAHYQETISLDQLAQQFHRDKYALAHHFKHHSGTTITAALTQIRLSHAKTQLCQTHHSIHEIAQHCGFSSTSYFIQCFRKKFHLTPLQYRKQYQRNKRVLR